jgi:DNA-binding NarL/FixJ family response regulator
MHSDPDYVSAAFAAGAHGYVVKKRQSLDLVPALQAATQGERFISPSPELEGME